MTEVDNVAQEEVDLKLEGILKVVAPLLVGEGGDYKVLLANLDQLRRDEDSLGGKQTRERNRHRIIIASLLSNVALREKIDLLEKRIFMLTETVTNLANNEVLMDAVANHTALKIIKDGDAWIVRGEILESSHVDEAPQPGSLRISVVDGKVSYHAISPDNEERVTNVDNLPVDLVYVLSEILVKHKVSIAGGGSVWLTYSNSDKLYDLTPEEVVVDSLEEKVLNELAEGKAPDDEETYDDEEILEIMDSVEYVTD